MQFNPTAPLTGHPNAAQSSPYLGSGAQSAPSLDSSLQSHIASRQVASTGPPKHKQHGFLAGLANFHMSRGHPLPPGLVGMPYPSGYDPTNSPWKNVECTQGEVGSFRLGAKDVKLFQLWTTVVQAGGYLKVGALWLFLFQHNVTVLHGQVMQQNGWNQIIRHFDLPELLPGHPASGQRSSAQVLASYYNAILHPFEEVWRRNVQENNRKVMMSGGRPPGSSTGISNTPSGVAHPPGMISPAAASQTGGTPNVNNMVILMNTLI